jgi:hypothetical protein
LWARQVQRCTKNARNFREWQIGKGWAQNKEARGNKGNREGEEAKDDDWPKVDDFADAKMEIKFEFDVLELLKLRKNDEMRHGKVGIVDGRGQLGWGERMARPKGNIAGQIPLKLWDYRL